MAFSHILEDVKNFTQIFEPALCELKPNNYSTSVWRPLNYFSDTVEPRFNEVAGDRPNLFVKSRVRYIENLDITNLRGNDQKVRYIEVIVNDWFGTQVTSLTQFNAFFVTQKCSVLICKSFIKHGDLQCQLFSLLSRRSAFVYGTKEQHFQSSDLKMLQHRGYWKQKIVFINKKTGFSVVMLHYPIFPDFKDLNFLPLMCVSLLKAFTVQT